VVVAGEPCAPHVLQTHNARLPHARLYNEYGPTEATVWSSVSELTESTDTSGTDKTSISIGRPIDGTSMRCIDPHGQAVPDDFIGEIEIFGPGVAAGYVNGDGYSPNDFVREHTYRTGDVGYRDKGGKFYFVGRIDRQIKLRGQRIDPVEIEDAVLTLAGVKEAYVSMQIPITGHRPALTVHLSQAADTEDYDVAALNDHLQTYLPRSSLPQFVVHVDRLPRNAHGKVDTEALPKPTRASTTQGDGQFDREEAQDIVQVWCNVLDLATLDADADFFELGGDSINALEVTVALRKAGFVVSPNDIFEYSNLTQFSARMLDGLVSKKAGESAAKAAAEVEQIPTNAAEWFFASGFANPDHWNMPLLIRLDAGIDLDALSKALAHVAAAYPALSTAYRLDTNGPRIEKQNPKPLHVKQNPKPLHVGRDALNPHPDVLAWAASLQNTLDLSDGRLFRAQLLTDAHNYLALVFHHLAVQPPDHPE